MTNEQLNKFILCLFDETRPIEESTIDMVIEDNDFHVEIAANELKRLEIIDVATTMDGKEYKYSLKRPARMKIQNLPRVFIGRPYEYFLEENQKNEEEEKAHKWYLRQDAKQRFDDYPIIKRQRNLSILIAILSIIVSTVLGVLSY